MCPLVVTLRIYNLKLTKQHVKKQQQQININMIKKNIYFPAEISKQKQLEIVSCNSIARICKYSGHYCLEFTLL